VLVTENMFGDILTDEASMLARSLGVVCLRRRWARAKRVYMSLSMAPARPSIAGKGIANPVGDDHGV